MANYTKKAIIQTFGEMLAEMPFERITVTVLAARCEISSNTFYYHFHSIFDLTEAYIAAKFDKYMSRESFGAGLENALKSFLYAIKDNIQTVLNLYNYFPQRRLEEYFLKILEKRISDILKIKTDDKSIPKEDFENITSFLSCSLLGLLLKFIWNCGAANIEQEVKNIDEIVSLCTDGIINKRVC